MTSSPASSLPELPADEAAGDIKLIYDALEASLGVRLVNLVYRHLATVPGALEWAWAVVGARFEDGTFAEHSGKLIEPVAQGTPAAPIEPDLSAADLGRVLETLDAYNRANPMNAISLRVIALALQDGRPALYRPPSAVASESLTPLLPMARLDSLEPAVAETLSRLARLTTGGEAGLVPSLYRHFVCWPDLLEKVADWMEPLVAGGMIDRESALVFDRADAAARAIYAGFDTPGAGGVGHAEEVRSGLIRTIEIFPPTICRMIVIAGLLRHALTD